MELRQSNTVGLLKPTPFIFPNFLLNLFFTIYPALGMAGVSKEAQLHGKFVLLWYSTRFEQNWNKFKHLQKSIMCLTVFLLWSNLVEWHTVSNFSFIFASLPSLRLYENWNLYLKKCSYYFLIKLQNNIFEDRINVLMLINISSVVEF